MLIRTETILQASPEQVWAVLTDFPAYSQWNPLVTQIEGRAIPGEKIRITIPLPYVNKSISLPCTIEVCEPDRELTWWGVTLGAWFAKGRHFHKLEDLGNGQTKLIHGERFSGFGTLSMSLMPGKKKLTKMYEA